MRDFRVVADDNLTAVWLILDGLCYHSKVIIEGNTLAYLSIF